MFFFFFWGGGCFFFLLCVFWGVEGIGWFLGGWFVVFFWIFEVGLGGVVDWILGGSFFFFF